MSIITTKILTVNKGEEKTKAGTLADFYNEQRALGKHVSRAHINAVGDALNITVYVSENQGEPVNVKKECAIIRVERGKEEEGAAEISAFCNEHQGTNVSISRPVAVTVGNDTVYVIFSDTDCNPDADVCNDPDNEPDYYDDDPDDRDSDDEPDYYDDDPDDEPSGCYADESDDDGSDDEPDYFE